MTAIAIWAAAPAATHAFYARWRDCLCIVAVCVDQPGYEDDTAMHVEDYRRRGYRVELLAIGTQGPWRCAVHPKGTPEPWRHA